MKQIALVTNFNIYDKANAALLVAEELIKYDVNVLFASISKDRIFRMHKNRKEYTYLPLDELYQTADCVIVLGGDGSLLDAARRAAPYGKPLLGINMGRLGYMTELEISQVEKLKQLCEGNFHLDKRAMLHIAIRTSNGGIRQETFALNEAVISNGSVARIVDLELYANGNAVTSYRADGVIVATPTGSTAYSMSAGGPIVDPHLNCFCVTPICSHAFNERPVLFRDDAVLEIKNTCQREKMLYLTVDGRNNFEIYSGDSVVMTKSAITTSLIRLEKDDFYARLKKKLTQ